MSLRFNDGEGMNEVKINTAELLGIIQGNLCQHKDDVEQAKKARDKKYLIDLGVALGEPERLSTVTADKIPDNTKKYERLIRMLELTVDVEVSLSVSQFDEYVMDEWNETVMLKNLMGSYSASGMM